ncbi:MAG: di-trans,poly-cis-decaprenylcistransferase [Gemmatimonadaceae bacterium]
MTPAPAGLPRAADAPRSLHVAIIMDGNGRWATARGLPRSAGHHAGLRAARRIVEAAVRDGAVGTLTLYAFSADNWKRPPGEVGALMALFRRALATEAKRCLDNGVRLTILGRRDRLPESLRATITDVERATARGRNLHLRVAVDYSARDAIVRAAARAAAESRGAALTREAFTTLLGAVDHDVGSRDVDLLIRTGGEQRLSDFMLWECAYAELFFSRRLWPDFDEDDFAEALREFATRERRFGRVPAQAAS